MKKGLVTILVFFSLIIIIGSVNVYASVDKICREDCQSSKNLGLSVCSDTDNLCKESCIDFKTKRKCISNCSKEKTECLKIVKSEFNSCEKYCRYKDKNITCLNGKYKFGEQFISGCKVCTCDYNKRVSCKSTDFCNFELGEINEGMCNEGGGFYSGLCNGPYFDIVCSSQNFCLCDGNSNYTCPSGFNCLHEFSLSLSRRGHTIPGWKTLLGFDLGNVGICVKTPELPSCGNDLCENLCDNKTCKSAENFLNCPNDCRLD